MFDISKLPELNSATKYPSILTYHGLDPKNGNLIEDQPTAFEGPVVLTEKVDGTNARIILLPDGDWLIGSREELLHFKGDRIPNPALGIVEALKPLANRLEGSGSKHIQVFYLEVYGHKVGAAAKQYTTQGNVGYRLFDIAFAPIEALDWDRERISSWRDGGGQLFGTEGTLRRASEAEDIPLVPRLGLVPGESLPTSLEGMRDFLTGAVENTWVGLDGDGGVEGKGEGLVLRSKDRKTIAKARFQDYERTLKRRAQKGGK